MRKLIIPVVVAVSAALLATPATAARPARATVEVSTVGGEAPGIGSELVFSGCGYEPGRGVNVLVTSPTATTFMGNLADANGCFSTAEVSLYTVNSAGEHEVATYQSHRRRADARLTFLIAS